MTRPYPHRPDVANAEDGYPFAAEGVGRVRATVQRRGYADPGVLASGLDALWEAVAWGWFLERPVEDLRAMLPPAAELVRSGLDSPGGRPAHLRDIGLWVSTALLAGDAPAAARAGAVEVPSPEQEGDWLPFTLAALARGDEAAAADGAARLREAVAAPSTAPEIAEALSHLGDVADAVVRRDQSPLDAALTARADVLAGMYATRARRRLWTGVLDRDSVGLVLAGTRRGLVVPEGVAVVPAELLAGLGATDVAPAGEG